MSRRTIAVARAVGVIGATASLIVGATLAALTSTATLTANTISTATADLKVWSGTDFVPSTPGFTVNNLIPGVASADMPFYLRNGGGVPLTITAHVPSAPSSSGFSGWENLKVTIKGDDAGEVKETNMGELLANQVPLPSQPLAAGAQGNSNVAGTEGNYTISFKLDPLSIDEGAGQVTVDEFNIVFTGTQTAP